MKKELKNFDTIVGIILIVLTVISLVIDLFVFTHGICNNDIYHIEKIEALITSTPFTILFWVDNCLIYLFAFIYIVNAISTKKEMLVKISFSIFSILTTIIIATQLINVVGEWFGMF